MIYKSKKRTKKNKLSVKRRTNPGSLKHWSDLEDKEKKKVLEDLIGTSVVIKIGIGKPILPSAEIKGILEETDRYFSVVDRNSNAVFEFKDVVGVFTNSKDPAWIVIR